MSEMEELTMTTRLNVRNLAELCGCFHALVWDALEEPIQPIDVLRAVAAEKDGFLNPYPEPGPNSSCTWGRADHIQRIAWFVVNGWDSPIEVNLNDGQTAFYAGWPVVDGLHRLAAAYVRLDQYIEAIVDGCLSDHANLLSTTSIRLDELQLTADFTLEGGRFRDEYGLALA